MSTSTKWFIGIVVAVICFAILVLAFSFYAVSTALFTFSSSDEEYEPSGFSADAVGIIELNDVITQSDDIVRQLRKYQKNRSIKAIVLRINSPGGSVAPSQEMYDEVRKTRDAGKPVVVSMGSVAASGGYYISLGASKIVANPGTITGSIGVISQFMNVAPLMQKLGIEHRTIKSGKMKDAGSPFREMSEEEALYWQTTINNVYEQFVTAVAKERRLTVDRVHELADGRVYTGEQAYSLGLVDSLGTYQTAISLAGTLGKIQGEPRIQKEYKRRPLLEQFVGNEVSEKVKSLPSLPTHESILEYRLPFR